MSVLAMTAVREWSFSVLISSFFALFSLSCPAEQGVTDWLSWFPGAQPGSNHHSAWCSITALCSCQSLCLSVFSLRKPLKRIFFTLLASADRVPFGFLCQEDGIRSCLFCTLADGYSPKCLESSVIVLAALCRCSPLTQGVKNYTFKRHLARA